MEQVDGIRLQEFRRAKKEIRVDRFMLNNRVRKSNIVKEITGLVIVRI